MTHIFIYVLRKSLKQNYLLVINICYDTIFLDLIS